jgi:hypothetical protein
VNRIVRIKGLLLAGVLAIGPAAFAQQEKPRVYINGTGNTDVRMEASAAGGSTWVAGSSPLTEAAHNQAMELAKDISKQCPSAIVTLNVTDADYTVGLNREASHALIFKNNQVTVTNRRGDILTSNTSRAVSHSTNDSCAAILADWKANGKIETPAPITPAPAAASQQQVTATPVSTTSTPASASQFSIHVVDPQPESLGDAARRLKTQKQQPSHAPQK